MAYRYSVPNYDTWLERWLPLSGRQAGVALDVGCGPGLDTRFLSDHGWEVHACDISEEALSESRKVNPNVAHQKADGRDLAPYRDGTFDLVVAGLSLHYFDREDSHRAFKTVHRLLKPDGLFVFRLNAWDDYAFGAPVTFHAWQWVEEPTGKKQFFSEAMIRELVAGRFELLGVEKKRSDRYTKPKSFFECCAKKLTAS